MTRPLRRAHLLTWVMLCVGLGVLFLASLRVREATAPVNPQLRWETYP